MHLFIFYNARRKRGEKNIKRSKNYNNLDKATRFNKPILSEMQRNENENDRRMRSILIVTNMHVNA